ncbi:DUF3967 domain-containing protein [Bacillus bombysepticus]
MDHERLMQTIRELQVVKKMLATGKKTVRICR